MNKIDLIKLKKCNFTKTGLEISETTTKCEWQQIGQFLKTVEGAVQFWIGDWIRFGEKKWGEMYKDAILNTGLENQTLRVYKSVAENVDSRQRITGLSFGHHREVAHLEPKEQEKWLEKAEKEELTTRELKQEIVKSRVKSNPPLPEGQFNVIFADPPWKYNDKHDYNSTTGAETHYPTMSIEELCQMQIPSAENAVLFLWVTSPLLEECFEVIKAWGFIYKTSFVWDKVKHNMGHYNSVRHEFLLVATKGSYLPENKKLFDSVITIPRSEKHSEKPDEFRKLIETLYPSGKKLELFGRKKAAGWTVWGNEI